jgi:hypothetical protein
MLSVQIYFYNLQGTYLFCIHILSRDCVVRLLLFCLATVCFGKLLSAYQEKIPARNSIYAHAQDFAASDELLLVILKAFIPQPLNKQQTKSL